MVARIKLLPYQKEGVRTIEKYDGRLLIADEMGLGKTIQTLTALKRNPDWLPALVVCPACVKYNWEYESLRHVGLQSSVCEGRKPPVYNRNDFSTISPLTIINYDILKDWKEYLKKLRFKTIVMDEVHYLKNPQTKRRKAAKSISNSMEHVLALSGTALTNCPDELWSTLNLLWPDEFESFWEFAQEFCKPRMTPWGLNTKGATNLPELHRRIKLHGMLRRKKVDVLKDLPAKMRRILPIEIEDRQSYNHAKNDFIGWLKKNAPHKVHSASKAQKLVQAGELCRLVARLKMKGIVDWVNRFMEEREDKFVLMAHHKKAVSLFQRRIKAKSVTVNGSVSAKMKQAAVDQFQNDPKTRLFIGNHASAGIGTTLTAASEMGIAELPATPGMLNQVEDRIWRIGQDNQVTINYFVAGGTVEEKLCEMIQRKQKVVSSVLDGGTMEGDINIYEELVHYLENSLI